MAVCSDESVSFDGLPAPALRLLSAPRQVPGRSPCPRQGNCEK